MQMPICIDWNIGQMLTSVLSMADNSIGSCSVTLKLQYRNRVCIKFHPSAHSCGILHSSFMFHEPATDNATFIGIAQRQCRVVDNNGRNLLRSHCRIKSIFSDAISRSTIHRRCYTSRQLQGSAVDVQIMLMKFKFSSIFIVDIRQRLKQRKPLHDNFCSIRAAKFRYLERWEGIW